MKEFIRKLAAKFSSLAVHAVAKYHTYCEAENKKYRKQCADEAEQRQIQSVMTQYAPIASVLHSAIANTAPVTRVVVPPYQAKLYCTTPALKSADGVLMAHYSGLYQCSDKTAKEIQQILQNDLDRQTYFMNLPPLKIFVQLHPNSRIDFRIAYALNVITARNRRLKKIV